MGLTRAAAKAMGDDRRRRSVVHSTLAIVRQRVHALALGHEDLNDHGALRRDPPTLCRFERKSDPAEAMALHEVLFEQFVKANRRFVIGKLRFPQAHPKPPKRVVLDFDATDITLH